MTKQEFNEHLLRTTANYRLYEFDPFFLKIQDSNKAFVISLSLKSFTNTLTKPYQRPFVAVYYLTKPCDFNCAIDKAIAYYNFITS